MQPLWVGTASLLVVLALVYRIFFRSWQLRWGASDAEIQRAMPGDDIVGTPSFNATRAVTIDAFAGHCVQSADRVF